MRWLITFNSSAGYATTCVFHDPLEIALAHIKENEAVVGIPYTGSILNVVGLTPIQAVYLLDNGYEEYDY